MRAELGGTYYRRRLVFAQQLLGGPRVEHLDKNARQRLSNSKPCSLLGFNREQQRKRVRHSCHLHSGLSMGNAARSQYTDECVAEI